MLYILIEQIHLHFNLLFTINLNCKVNIDENRFEPIQNKFLVVLGVCLDVCLSWELKILLSKNLRKNVKIFILTCEIIFEESLSLICENEVQPNWHLKTLK